MLTSFFACDNETGNRCKTTAHKSDIIEQVVIMFALGRCCFHQYDRLSKSNGNLSNVTVVKRFFCREGGKNAICYQMAKLTPQLQISNYN